MRSQGQRSRSLGQKCEHRFGAQLGEKCTDSCNTKTLNHNFILHFSSNKTQQRKMRTFCRAHARLSCSGRGMSGGRVSINDYRSKITEHFVFDAILCESYRVFQKKTAQSLMHHNFATASQSHAVFTKMVRN